MQVTLLRLPIQRLPSESTSEWISGRTIIQIYYVPKAIPLDWKPNDLISENRTPYVFASLEPEQDLSEFERSMMELVEEGLATKEYVQDVFMQEQIFKDNFEKIRKENPDKAIVVCAGKIFVGDSVRELEKQARSEFPSRPTYSYSPATEF